MAKYAVGKNALGISDRSGVAYRLNDMKREWTGALVGPDEWEEKQPQLRVRRTLAEAQALKNPRPDKPEALTVPLGIPTVETDYVPVIGVGQTGQLTVTTT
jgi:hypothetical protein|tara:strand:- start:68 stop:370 length:303 start_codon:yes stop_codon:yes gene_type:complete